MAVKFPLANGVWSNEANWNDGTLPQEGDDVYADGKTISIDVATITVTSIRTDIRTGGTNGGRFNLGSGIPVFNITANIFTGVANNVITINIGVACTLNLVGNLFGATGGVSTAALASRAVSIESSNVILNITGNIAAGSSQQAHTVISFQTTLNNTTVNLIGNINTTGSGIQSVLLGTNVNTNINSCNINITGNVTSTSTGDATRAIYFRFGTNNNFILNGIASHVSGDSSGILLLLSNNNNTIFIDECTSNASGNAVALSQNTLAVNSGGTITVRKLTHPSTTFRNIISVGTNCNVIYRELVMPSLIRLKSDDYYVEAVDSLDNTLTLTEIDDINLRLPAQADVRESISYNDGNRTGTMAVPVASNVRKDVPVDDTVGTADLTAEDILNAILTSENPVAERLRNVSTVQTTGDQIAGS
jgi:hypothetical protein